MRLVEWSWSEKQENMQTVDITVEHVERRHFLFLPLRSTTQRTIYWGYYVTWYRYPEMIEVDVSTSLELCTLWHAIRNGFRDDLRSKRP